MTCRVISKVNKCKFIVTLSRGYLPLGSVNVECSDVTDRMRKCCRAKLVPTSGLYFWRSHFQLPSSSDRIMFNSELFGKCTEENFCISFIFVYYFKLFFLVLPLKSLILHRFFWKNGGTAKKNGKTVASKKPEKTFFPTMIKCDIFMRWLAR